MLFLLKDEWEVGNLLPFLKVFAPCVMEKRNGKMVTYGNFIAVDSYVYLITAHCKCSISFSRRLKHRKAHKNATPILILQHKHV